MILQLYDTGIHSAAMNMAIDTVLLNKKEPVLRFYQWPGTAITLGRFQNCREVNIAATQKDCIPVVRRETGGKAVLHGEDLTISIILNKSRAAGSIKEAIKPVGNGIVQGLYRLGINAQQVCPGKIYHSSTYCFSIHSPYEVVVGMKKIAGIAGRMYRKRILFQISIPLSVNIKNVKKYFYFNQVNNPEPVHSIGLSEMLPLHCKLESVKKALISGFQKSLCAGITVAALLKTELEQAGCIAARKYSLDQWNLAQ